ncbi:MAG: phosphodiester glycosidase family protein, partial [Oscillospiraceae bacterium]|nr:phosphodiester glycosidase family protein [Oscillospiraceae bacterium]
MKKWIFAAFTAAALSLSLFQAAAAAGAGSAKYIHTQALADNLKYVNTVYWHDEYGREESYILRCEPGGEVYPIVMKDDTLYGRVDVAASEAYARSQGKNVFAAVNADFFSMQTGIPLGIVIQDGVYKSSPEGESAAAFRADGSLFFSESPNIELTLTNQGGETDSENAGKSVALTHLNKLRNDSGRAYLYTSDFSTVSTRASSPGWFARFEIVEGELTLSGEVTLRVTEVSRSEGETPIGDNSILLTRAGEPNEDYYKFAKDDIVKLTASCSDESLKQARWAVGCGDFIVRNGAAADSSGWDKALIQRNPRTAIGVTASGETVVCVVDGRDSTYANGVTLTELADEMAAQGCVTAVNLDGGGSSVMSVRKPGQRESAVVNRPSDGAPRRCSTYIMFASDVGGASDGYSAPRRLALENDGVLVLAGSSVELAYTAEDFSYQPAPAPEDITAQSSALGVVNGNIYTAGATQGADAITLYSPSAGASGSGEVFVLTAPTSVAAYDASSSEITDVTASPGGSLALAPVATYYRKTVTAQPNSFAYEVTGGIGAVSPDGVFTAAGKSGVSGEIKITAGSREAVVKVNVHGFEDTVGHWAWEYIDELRTLGVVEGVTDTEFVPGAEIRRADFVLMLHRALGYPAPVASEELPVPEPVPTEPIPEIPATETPVPDTPETPETPEAPESEPPVAVPDESEDVTPPDATSSPEDESAEPYTEFDDVPADAYYADAVKWARSAGVVNGVSDRLFDPTAPLTREQAFTLVYRTFEMFNITLRDGYEPELYGFEDIPDVSDYAVRGSAALVASGIVEGSDGRLNPKLSVSRAEMAKLLCMVLRLRDTEIAPDATATEPADGA